MRSDRLYLVDILEACDAIARFLAGAMTDAWVQDEVRQSAVMHKLIVIGEAAARLSNDFRTAHAELDWPGIIGFRNLAVHEYFAVSWSIVWVTATEDVPTLRSHVERILGEAFGSG